MNWELIEVGETKWIQDNSGYYTLIHYIENGEVRIDFMDRNDMPVISFQGLADDVRKATMQYITKRSRKVGGIGKKMNISLEHASYIGAELIRCAMQKINYVQD